MDIREKLVELLMQVEDNMCDDCGREPVGCAVVAIADHLLANGVTVQEWIPVTDDSPKNGVKVLITDGEVVFRGYRRPDGVWKCGVELHQTWDKVSLYPPTHWMPLPQPPKGE